MILMGVIQYRDYKYCFIGLLGILFTFGFFKYVPIFPSPESFRNNPEITQSLIKNAQSDLNNLVTSIEFYKLEHNKYPDSLGQLKSQGTVWMYDNITSVLHINGNTTTSAPLYNYKRIGNKYTIFSSGIDCKPHTKDDIYPSVNLADTSKFGFIKQ